MKFNPLQRQETPLYAVAQEPPRKQANGRVVVRGGVKTILKHKPYHPVGPQERVLKNYVLPVGGFR